MKSIHWTLLFVVFIFLGCGEDSATEEIEEQTVVTEDSIPTIEGDFIFLADAAVLKGKDFIYGVQIDSVSRKLADSVATFKKDEFEMIPVKVRAKVVPNPGQNGWDELVQIQEVLEISPRIPDTSAVPKIKKDIEKP